MQRILDFVLRFKEYVATTLLTIISLVLISSSSNTQLRSFRTVSVGFVAGVQSAFSWVPNPFALKSENRILRQLSRDLSLQAIQLRDDALKGEKYRAMLDFRQRSPMKLATAEVVGRLSIETRNYVTLNIGEKKGIREGMPVMTERGLVGRVVGLNGNYSIVQLLTHRDTRVTARMLSSRQNGVVVWDGGRNLVLRDVPIGQKPKKGDTVVTSELSSYFPEGIVIGTVSVVEDEPGTLYSRITLTPAVDFSTMEEAFVVLHSPDQERLDLERKFMEAVDRPTERQEKRSR